MSSVAPPTNVMARPSLGRPSYPGGPRRVPSVNSLDALANPAERDGSWITPVISGKPSKRPLDAESRQSSGNSAHTKSLANSPKRMAFEEWLVKACMETSRKQTQAQETGPAVKSALPAGNCSSGDSGDLEALILKACLDDMAPEALKKVDSWLTGARAGAASLEGSCRTALKTSPVPSGSDLSMDNFAANSSDHSDAYSTAGSSAELSGAPDSEPLTTTAGKVDPPKIVTGQELEVEANAPEATASTPAQIGDQSLTPLKRTRPEVGRKGGLGFPSLASMLAYPWLAASAAASTAIETLGYALAVFEDEEWGAGVEKSTRASPESGGSSGEASDASDDSMSGYAGMFPKAQERSKVQAVVPGRVGLKGRLEGFNRLQTQQQQQQQKQYAARNKRGETWEEVLRKRQAAKAFAKFLNQTRGKLVANRIYIPEQDGERVPLWKRRSFKQPCSILLKPRKGAAAPPSASKAKFAPAASEMNLKVGAEVIASPIWQRRAVGPPTPLSMGRRKVPQQTPQPLGIRQPQVPSVRVH